MARAASSPGCQETAAVPPSSTVTTTRRKKVSQTSFLRSPGSARAPAAGAMPYLMADAMVKMGRYMAIMK